MTGRSNQHVVHVSDAAVREAHLPPRTMPQIPFEEGLDIPPHPNTAFRVLFRVMRELLDGTRAFPGTPDQTRNFERCRLILQEYYRDGFKLREGVGRAWFNEYRAAALRVVYDALEPQGIGPEDVRNCLAGFRFEDWLVSVSQWMECPAKTQVPGVCRFSRGKGSADAALGLLRFLGFPGVEIRDGLIRPRFDPKVGVLFEVFDRAKPQEPRHRFLVAWPDGAPLASLCSAKRRDPSLVFYGPCYEFYRLLEHDGPVDLLTALSDRFVQNRHSETGMVAAILPEQAGFLPEKLPVPQHYAGSALRPRPVWPSFRDAVKIIDYVHPQTNEPVLRVKIGPHRDRLIVQTDFQGAYAEICGKWDHARFLGEVRKFHAGLRFDLPQLPDLPVRMTHPTGRPDSAHVFFLGPWRLPAEYKFGVVSPHFVQYQGTPCIGLWAPGGFKNRESPLHLFTAASSAKDLRVVPGPWEPHEFNPQRMSKAVARLLSKDDREFSRGWHQLERLAMRFPQQYLAWGNRQKTSSDEFYALLRIAEQGCLTAQAESWTAVFDLLKKFAKNRTSMDAWLVLQKMARMNPEGLLRSLEGLEKQSTEPVRNFTHKLLESTPGEVLLRTIYMQGRSNPVIEGALSRRVRL